MPAPLPAPQPNPQTPQQIGSLLETLYGAPQTISKFGCYFYLQNFTFSDFPAAAGWAMINGTQAVVTKYSQYARSADVQLFVQPLTALNINAPKLFSGQN
jgi:hypothetical protein